MAGIFDTLAQVGRDTAGLGADAEKARRGAEAWARAQELKAAKAAVPAAPTGLAYGAGKAVGRMVGGRLVPALAIGDMGFGMADQAEATTVGATPENRPERALQILAGADVTGLGARIGRMVSGGDFFGAAPVAPPAIPAVAPAAATQPVARTSASQADVRKSDNMTAANSMPVVDGAWVAPHGASPGIGAQLEPGAATTAVSSSRDANGNLVLTNAPPGPAGPGAAPQGYQAAPGSLASFFGASMRQRQAATEEKAAQAAALKLPEFMKTGAEATILSERMKLAAAEPDPARKAAILAGHVMSEPKLQAPPNMQPLPGDKDQSGVVFDPAKGAFRKVPITQPVTVANIDAALAGSMKGKTRAQVIQAYKDKGYDVSGVK